MGHKPERCLTNQLQNEKVGHAFETTVRQRVEEMTSREEPQHLLAGAQEAARAAGELIRQSWPQVREIQYKSAIDLVTTVDRKSEECIVAILQRRFPGHSILAEEETTLAGDSHAYRWIVDPLDGTTNFVHTYPHVCISIALELRGEIVLGLVYDPLREERFTALKGQGAFLNGKPIHISHVEELDKALLATGFPYDRRERADSYLGVFRAFMIASQGVRRNGSAALDLCYVASGRVEGFWELKLHAWDVAAGALIVEEAGGRLSDFSGESFSIWGEEILASNYRIHQEMLDILKDRKTCCSNVNLSG